MGVGQWRQGRGLLAEPLEYVWVPTASARDSKSAGLAGRWELSHSREVDGVQVTKGLIGHAKRET